MGVIGALLGLLPIVCKRWLVNWWGGEFSSSSFSLCVNPPCSVADEHEAFKTHTVNGLHDICVYEPFSTL